MKPKKIFQFLVVAFMGSLLLIPTNSFAAGKADFTGKWILNESKSNLGEGRTFSAVKMNVQQNGNTISIERTRSGRNGQERTTNETLTMDGKENIIKNENRSTVSVATWSDDGNTLTIKSQREFSRQGETFQMKSTETWTMGADGKTLKIQSDSSSQRGERSVTLVYDKE
ncbi:MAG TPA: hypothetical protein VJ963_11730 [Bacteroidales bacterium]|nr:hypothetical protein [Bacteroidales bacterium]